MNPQFAAETSETGEFQRQDDAFREWISNDGSTPYVGTHDLDLKVHNASFTIIYGF